MNIIKIILIWGWKIYPNQNIMFNYIAITMHNLDCILIFVSFSFFCKSSLIAITIKSHCIIQNMSAKEEPQEVICLHIFAIQSATSLYCSCSMKQDNKYLNLYDLPEKQIVDAFKINTNLKLSDCILRNMQFTQVFIVKATAKKTENI